MTFLPTTIMRRRSVIPELLGISKATTRRVSFLPNLPFGSTEASSSRFVRSTFHSSRRLPPLLSNTVTYNTDFLAVERRKRHFTTSLSDAVAENRNIRSYDSHYINGEWTSPSTNGTINVINSNNGKTVATIPSGTEEDTIKAIQAAKKALLEWKNTRPSERWHYMNNFVQHLESKVDEIVDRLSVELGCTKRFAKNVQIMAAISQIRTILDLLDNDGQVDIGNPEFEWEYAAGTNTVVREPIGVVGSITPWNYPLYQIVLKVIPALLAGCTVVLKPSESTPLCAYTFAEAMDEIGLPKGVFNMVQGTGPSCGEVLAKHPDVDLVSFTGSTRVGKILRGVAANSGTLKDIRTELGGKSASILLDDANFRRFVPTYVKHVTSNTGQSCNALSRMLVPRDRYEEVLEIAAKAMEKEIVGCAFTNPETSIGPLVSEDQYNIVRSYIQKGITEGARIVTGGLDPPKGTEGSGGYFVKPTLFACTNDTTIAQEEIFGPVLCVIPYDTEEEAIKLANDTQYGLNNAVASRDLRRALNVASKLESGVVGGVEFYDFSTCFLGFRFNN